MSKSSQLRVGDADRDHAVARLREAFAEGRLSHAELDERLDTAHAAVTQGQIRAVVADLPVPRGRRRSTSMPWTYLEVNGVLWGIWGVQEVVGGGAHGLWPLWVSVPWGALVVVDRSRRLVRRRGRRLAG